MKTNKSIYFVISILDINKTLMYEFWYDYIKPKYPGRAKLCYMDTEGSLFTLKLKMFTKVLKMILKNGLTHLTMMIKNTSDR